MFIQIEELYSAIDKHYLNAITQNDDLIIISCIETAVEEASVYLNKYNTNEIFSAKGEARNKLLVQFIKDIAIYNLIELDTTGVDVSDRVKRYERAISWLKEAQKNEVKSLPLQASTKQLVYMSSRQKTENYFD